MSKSSSLSNAQLQHCKERLDTLYNNAIIYLKAKHCTVSEKKLTDKEKIEVLMGLLKDSNIQITSNYYALQGLDFSALETEGQFDDTFDEAIAVLRMDKTDTYDRIVLGDASHALQELADFAKRYSD